MYLRIFTVAAVAWAVITGPTHAQTYDIKVTYSSGSCGNFRGASWRLTISGGEIRGQAGVGSGFTARIQPDGTFKTTFKSARGDMDLLAEGNTLSKPRTLKISVPSMGCVTDGKE